MLAGWSSRRGVLQKSAIDPRHVADELSAAYLIAVSGRAVAELGEITSRADGATRIPTLTVDAVIGFASAEDRAAFARELHTAVADLVSRYHDDGGRPHRLTIASYPKPKEEQ